MDAAITLVKGLYKYCNITIPVAICNLDLSFWELGGTSVNAMAFLLHLNRQGYPISTELILFNYYLTTSLIIYRLKTIFFLKSALLFSVLRDFLKASTLSELITEMSKKKPTNNVSQTTMVPSDFHVLEVFDKYDVEIMHHRHRDDVIQ